MKRGILVATLIMTAGGVASANLLTTAPQGVASPWPQAQPATETTRPLTKAVAAKTEAAPAPAVPIAAKSASAPTVQKASVGPRRALVPSQMRARPPVNLPPVDDKTTETNKASDKPGEPLSDPAAGGAAGESRARAAIEADGYKGVKVLRKGVNGVWHASALRGNATVMLTVDSSGSVSAD